MTQSLLSCESLSFAYGKNPVLRDISLSFEPGRLTALLGPNGCGKTTLLRCLSGLLTPQSGAVTLCGRPLFSMPRREVARALSLLPQLRGTPDITAESLVAHGRFPHLGFSRSLSENDRRLVLDAMEQTHVTSLAARPLTALSGGERQRVYLAMLLAQNTKVVLLDEPTTHLDLKHKFEVLDLLSAMRDSGRTVAVVLHDLALALKYADRVVLLDGGTVAAAGTPDALYESGALDRVFSVSLRRTVLDGRVEYVERKKIL